MGAKMHRGMTIITICKKGLNNMAILVFSIIKQINWVTPPRSWEKIT
jgi:hypothetical protein